MRLGSALLGWAQLGSARPGAAAAPGLIPPGEPLALDSAQKGAAGLLRERYLGAGWCGSGAQLGTTSCKKQASLGICALQGWLWSVAGVEWLLNSLIWLRCP